MLIPPSMRTLIAASAFALFAVAPAAAQQPPAEEEQEIRQELQQIEQQLRQIEDRAMQEDPSLQERQEALNDLVVETMTEIDPSVEGKIERLEGLRSELQTAQQAQDMEKMQELMTEGQQIQKEIVPAQQAAMEDERVAGEIEEFKTQVTSKMEEIEPKTPTLIARAEELARRLQQPDAL